MSMAGFHILADQWALIVGILMVIVLSQLITGSILKKIFGDQITSIECLFLGLAGWILPASLMSLAWLFLGYRLTPALNIFFMVMIALGFLYFLRLTLRADPGPDSKPVFFFLLLFVSISILLRLDFVSGVMLPSYFDSAQHYTFIKNILNHGASAVFTLPASYYHMGYHVLVAFIVTILNAETAKTMLIFGQITLAVLPVGVYCLTYHLTGSKWAGIFAMTISAYGWYMPAHATDWGKYPALLSLGLISFVLNLAFLLSQHKSTLSPRQRWALYGILGVSVLMAVLIHSRSLAIFGIAFLAWNIAAWQQKFSQPQRAILFSTILVVILLEFVFIQQQTILALLFDPYIHSGILTTTLILFLSIFAQRNFPQLTLACLLAVCLLLGSVFVPIPGLIPGYNKLTVLDRPYVEMILYLPLSILGALGLAGLTENVQRREIKMISRNQYISVLAIGSVLINAFATYDLRPSRCCVIAGNDDVVAIDWMDAQLPKDVQIGIASTELEVLTSGTFEGILGSDAGAWITPLINRKTIPLSFNSDFGQEAVWNTLCQGGVSHLYIGELGQTFNEAQLSHHPAWYRIMLSMPRVKVYQVIGCSRK